MNMIPDFKELLAELNVGSVEYVVVGAYALSHHGHIRYTKDLDIFYRGTLENAARLRDALVRFGYAPSTMTVEDLASDRYIFYFGREPGRVDLMNSVSGVTFDQAWSNRETGQVGDELEFPVMGIHDFIANKRASGRPQDLADVHMLISAGRGKE